MTLRDLTIREEIFIFLDWLYRSKGYAVADEVDFFAVHEVKEIVDEYFKLTTPRGQDD